MKAWVLFFMLLGAGVNADTPDHCYFTTAAVTADECGVATLTTTGSPPTSTGLCVPAGTHKMGPTTNFSYPRSDVATGAPAFRNYWTGLASFSVGTYVYINTAGSGGTKHYIISWSDLGTLNRGLYLQSDGVSLRACMEYGNFTGVCGSYAVGVGECWWVGYSSDATAGKKLYAYNTAGAVSSVPVATDPSTEGTGSHTYVQWGRCVSLGGSILNGYAHKNVFYNRAVSTIPFDADPPAVLPAGWVSVNGLVKTK